MKALVKGFLQGLTAVIGSSRNHVALHAPEFAGREREFINDCLDSTFVSSVGRYVDQFEERLASYTGAKHAIVVANGTAALQVALHLAGVRPGDEVLVPALSFVATANAVAHCGAIPHFVDSEISNLGMDPNALERHLASTCRVTTEGVWNSITGRRIAAIVPMHCYGLAIDITRMLEIGRNYGIPIVEDAAEALGSYFQGRHLGTFGLLGTLSFNGNKIITTGGGGAILTNDSNLGRMAKHLTTTAKQPHQWAFFHDHVAWNYRMPNLNAALGCAQMEQLPRFLELKRQLAARYQKSFADIPGMSFVTESSDTRSNYWLNTIRLDQPDLVIRDEILAEVNTAGFQCRPTWSLLHRLPMYAECPRAPLPVAECLEASLINIPSSPCLLV